MSKKLQALTDDQLFDALREQVNKARNHANGHDRKMTQAIGVEMKKRGWGNKARAQIHLRQNP